MKEEPPAHQVAEMKYAEEHLRHLEEEDFLGTELEMAQTSSFAFDNVSFTLVFFLLPTKLFLNLSLIC